MDTIINTISETVQFLFTSLDGIKYCVNLVFQIFPSNIQELLTWGFGFILAVGVVLFFLKKK